MTISDFKKIARLLKKVYEELEAQAIKEGISLLSPEYKELMDRTRLAVLEKHGFTLEEYRSIKEQVAGVSKEGTLAVMQDTQKKLEEVEGRHIPTEEEIAEIAERVAQKYIVPPQITNEIVKEITIEKPQIIETTREIVRKEKYDDSKIQKKLEELKGQLAELKIPEPYDDSKLKEYFHDYFSENFEKNINTLGMPDFRKLAMGLQSQIDAISSNGTGGGHIIQDEGVSLTQRDTLNFTGTGVSVADSGGKTVVTINAAAGTVDTANSPNANEFARFTDADTIEGRTVSEVYGDLGITSSAAELNILDGATLTVTELNYVDGVTSAIQTQLDDKANTALSNLASVAVNTSIISDTDNTDNLGSTTISWANIYSTNLWGRNRSSAGVGYDFNISGGAVSNGAGAPVFLNGGAASVSGAGGHAYVRGGAPAGTAPGGDVRLNPAPGSGGGANGVVRIEDATSGLGVILSAASIASTDKTFTFPNVTGTLPVGTGTTNEISYWSGTNTLSTLATATYPSLTELSYVKGVTSAIQTQLNARATTAGALTQFVGNGNWKVWYSDGSGDVQELALGADGTFLKSNGAAAAPTFATPAGSGDVSKVGTPVNNQVGVWTGDGTLEGDADLTFDTTTNILAVAGNSVATELLAIAYAVAL